MLAFRESARERSVSLRLEVAHETLDPLGKWLLALGGDVSEVFTRPLEGL